MKGADQHPKPGTVEYRFSAHKYGSVSYYIEARAYTFKRGGKYKSTDLITSKFVYLDELHGECEWCEKRHDTMQSAFDCANEAAMLAVLIHTGENEVDDDDEFFRIAKEKGYEHG